MKVGILHTAFIGDVILSGLLVEALCAAGHEIVYFTKKNTSSIFSSDVRIKKVVDIHKGKGLGKIFAIKNIAKQITEESLDLLLVPHRSATSTLCAYLSKVKLTIGFQNATLSFLYKKKAPFNKNMHECVRYLALLNNSFVSHDIIDFHMKLARPVLKYKDEIILNFSQKFALTEFNQPHLQKPVSFAEVQKNFFILAVGSVWKTKKYSIEHWTEVTFQFLLKYPHYFCVLTGSQTDKSDIDNFINLFGKKCEKAPQGKELLARVLSAANFFNLSEFALFTSQAKFVLSNDSSPVHFASAFNIPTLAIFGPTITEFGFAPTSTKNVVVSYVDENGQRLACQPCSIHGKNVCPLGHHKCMKDLLPHTVIKALENLIV